MLGTTLILGVLLQLIAVFGWQNNYDGPLQFECGDQEFISGVKSQHHNHNEDRQWEYSCTKLPAETKLEQCTWFTDVNEMDELLAFRCRGNGVITGVTSRHDNKFEDRVFGFQCCNVVNLKLYNCQITTFLNQYDDFMNYIVPNDYCIVGFESEHNNDYEDRRWKAEICEISKN